MSSNKNNKNSGERKNSTLTNHELQNVWKIVFNVVPGLMCLTRTEIIRCFLSALKPKWRVIFFLKNWTKWVSATDKWAWATELNDLLSFEEMDRRDQKKNRFILFNKSYADKTVGSATRNRTVITLFPFKWRNSHCWGYFESPSGRHVLASYVIMVVFLHGTRVCRFFSLLVHTQLVKRRT